MRRVWMSWGGVGLLCAAGFFTPLRFETDALFYIHLMDAAHLPAFFALTLFAYGFWPTNAEPCRRRIMAAGTVAGFSVAIEIIQPLVGRSESLIDLANGIAGVSLATLLLVARTSRKPLHLGGFLLLAIAATAFAFRPAWQESAGLRWRAMNFPTLADFEDDDELRLWIGSGLGNVRGDATAVERTQEHSSKGKWSLKVIVSTETQWPGVRLLNGRQDWRNYRFLAFDVWNAGDDFTLSMRVDDDFPHKLREDRYNADFKMRPDWNHVRIPISEIESSPANRRMNLSAIQRTIFYVNEPKLPHTFHIDNIRLE